MSIYLHGAIIALCMIAGAAVSVARGQDINFDQLNYHLYEAYAFVTGRLAEDVAPAQVIHSYFNPIVYLPFYYLVRHMPPRVAGAGLGALHGLNFWLVFVIARIVTRSLTPPARLTSIIAAVAISAAAPMVASEFGTSLADLVVSLPTLAGLALLMQTGDDRRHTIWTATTIMLGGALTGAAVGLKLTCASFAIGFAIASVVGWRSWRQRLLAIAATGIGGVTGFALTGGAWCLTLWGMFRNPVFPFFNAIFRSPDYPGVTSFFDARDIPHNILEAMSYPFFWTYRASTTTEIEFRDIRFAALIVLGLIALGLRLTGYGRMLGNTTPAGRRLIIYFGITFCIWMYVWSIQRYIVGLELLTGPAVIVLLRWCGLFAIANGRAVAAASVALAAACVVTVKPIDWGHLTWNRTWYNVNVPPTSNQRGIYLLDAENGDPLSYTVLALPPASPVIGIVNWENVPDWGDTVFTRRIHAILAGPAESQIWAIASGPLSESFKKRIALYGLKASDACETIPGRPATLTWCKLSRTAVSD